MIKPGNLYSIAGPEVWEVGQYLLCWETGFSFPPVNNNFLISIFYLNFVQLKNISIFDFTKPTRQFKFILSLLKCYICRRPRIWGGKASQLAVFDFNILPTTQLVALKCGSARGWWYRSLNSIAKPRPTYMSSFNWWICRNE